MEYLYGNKIISSKDNLEVYLIKASSIPKFIKKIKEVFKTVNSEKDLIEAENILKERLKDDAEFKSLSDKQKRNNLASVFEQKQDYFGTAQARHRGKLGAFGERARCFDNAQYASSSAYSFRRNADAAHGR